MSDQAVPLSKARVEAAGAEYIEGVVDPSVSWYERKARRDMVVFNVSRVLIIVLSLSMPVVAAQYSRSRDSTWRVLIDVVPVLVAILAALDGFFRWGDSWRSRRHTELALGRAKREYRVAVLAADGGRSESEVAIRALLAYEALVATTERLMSTEEEGFWGFRLQDRPESSAAKMAAPPAPGPG